MPGTEKGPYTGTRNDSMLQIVGQLAWVFGTHFQGHLSIKKKVLYNVAYLKKIIFKG